MQIAIKRVYETASSDDGVRIRVDKLWPRGLSKDRAKIDLWLQEVAPSNELRRWFNHEPEKWDEFRGRYWSLTTLREKLIKMGAKVVRHAKCRHLARSE